MLSDRHCEWALKNQTVKNDGDMCGSRSAYIRLYYYLCQKKSWQCSSRYLNVLYLLASLASKDGKTDIGDILYNKEQFPLGRIPALLRICPFEPCVL
jgi:hypothetical protein